MSVLDLVRLLAWLTCLGALSPAVIRMLRKQGRYLDPIWGLVFLLALNRLSYLFQVSAFWSNLTAVALAVSMAFLTLSYQRDDAV